MGAPPLIESTATTPLQIAEEELKESVLAQDQKEEFLERLQQTELSKDMKELISKVDDLERELEEYKKYLPKAKQLLKRHEKDEDFIALCLLKCCKLWTYESRLFEIGFGISTKEISNKLS
jgi:hypothetical protein